MGAATAKHVGLLEGLSSILDSLRVAGPLKKRCMKYQAFASLNNCNRDTEACFSTLSLELQTAIKLHMFDQLVRTTPFFRSIPMDTLKDIVSAFEEFVFSPGDVVIQKGDVGTDMFFISKGMVEVTIVTGEIIAIKSVGEYFGELGLVYDQPRAAQVSAKTFTILARLTRKDFHGIVRHRPELKNMIVKKIRSSVHERNAMVPDQTDGEDVPLLSADREHPTSGEELIALALSEVPKQAEHHGGQCDIDTLHSSIQRLIVEVGRLSGQVGAMESRLNGIDKQLAASADDQSRLFSTL